MIALYSGPWGIGEIAIAVVIIAAIVAAMASQPIHDSICHLFMRLPAKV